jgi:hypothetical protein
VGNGSEIVNQKRERGTVSSSPSLVFVVNAVAASAGRCQGAHRKSGVAIRRSYAFQVESVIPPFLLAYLPSTPVNAQMQVLSGSSCVNNANAFRPSLSAYALPGYQRLMKRKAPNSAGRSFSRQAEWLGGPRQKARATSLTRRRHGSMGSTSRPRSSSIVFGLLLLRLDLATLLPSLVNIDPR